MHFPFTKNKILFVVKCHCVKPSWSCVPTSPLRLFLGKSRLPWSRLSRRLSPLMATEGQYQYLQVLVRLVPTHKPASQYLLSSQFTGMGAPILAHLPPAKAGHLSHGLTHLPRHVPSFPHHPIATLRGLTLGLKVPTRQAKLLLTQTHSLLPRIVLPTLAPQPRVLH